MAEVTVLTPTGSKKGKVALAEDMFGVQPNVPVMHQVVTAQLAARRAGTQSTKTRAEVRGGGRKPYKQKGTGNARQGSIRAPQFSGGGVALGPKPRSYHQRTPKKMVRLALRSALSDRANEGRIVVVNGWDFDTPSTKSAAKALDALGIEGTVLVVLGREDETAVKSFRNLPAVQLILVTELNAYDVLTNDWIVFTIATLPGGETVVDDEPEAEAEKPTKAPAKATAKARPEVEEADEDDAEAAGFSKPGSQRAEDEEESK
jgi:large subunit ribosomal protein L4